MEEKSAFEKIVDACEDSGIAHQFPIFYLGHPIFITYFTVMGYKTTTLTSILGLEIIEDKK